MNRPKQNIQRAIGPWMLKELLGVGHQSAERSTNPYLLGVVFERLPKNLQRWWLREIDYDRQGEPLNVRRHLELVAAIAAYIESTARKCSEMLKNHTTKNIFPAAFAIAGRSRANKEFPANGHSNHGGKEVNNEAIQFPAVALRILIKRGYLKTNQIADRNAVKRARYQYFADMNSWAKVCEARAQSERRLPATQDSLGEDSPQK